MSSPLIAVSELHDQVLTGRAPVLLDIRWSLKDGSGHADYLAGHLPEAHFIDIEIDLAEPAGVGGRHPLPSRRRFASAMNRCGVDGASEIVCYDAETGASAARCWWLARYFGHPRVRLLDGGYRAWTDAGFPTTKGQTASAAGNFEFGSPTVRVVTADDVLARAQDGCLLDARAAERYLGTMEPVDAKSGHIPGAVNAPTTENNFADGRFLSPRQLRERFVRLGVLPGREVGVYCGSGVTAAHEVLALEVAGFDAALYPGSWSEWITDPLRPIRTGPENS